MFNLNTLQQNEGNCPHRPSATWQVSTSQREKWETKVSPSVAMITAQLGGLGCGVGGGGEDVCGYQGSSEGSNSQTRAFATSLSGHQRFQNNSYLLRVEQEGKAAAPTVCQAPRRGRGRLSLAQDSTSRFPAKTGPFSVCGRSLSLLRCQLRGGITVSSGHLLWHSLYLFDSSIRFGL